MKLTLGSFAGRATNRRTGPGQAGKLESLKSRLGRLEERIQDNERIWAGFRFIEISLIGTRDLTELLAVLRDSVFEAFEGIDAVSVTCFDEDFQMAHVLERSGAADTPDCIFYRIEPEVLDDLFSNFRQPMLGSCNEAIQSNLFPSFDR